jgi:hypothetical protein
MGNGRLKGEGRWEMGEGRWAMVGFQIQSLWKFRFALVEYAQQKD